MTPIRPLYLPPLFQDSVDHGRLILRDGSTATLHAARPSDREALSAFFERLSPESRLARFFSIQTPGADLVARFCDDSDPDRQRTLLVSRLRGGTPRIIAAASYLACAPDTAEVAFAVEDEFQGLGLGTILLERLALLAVMHGIQRLRAVTRADNRAMLDVFEHSGFPVQQRGDQDTVDVDLLVLPREESVARSEVRDRVFTAASLRPIFQPKSVAVVGASRDPSAIGFRILEGLIMNRFQGPVYPVNPKAPVLCSIRAWRSVRELPEAVDLAVIAVPRDAVLDTVDECAARGVRAIVVITAGFAEVDEAGRKLQETLVERVRGYGMRMVGPNCLGLLNADPAVRLNASFSPIFPPPGRVAMSSQSGALGLAILAHARRLDLGISTFISVGNKADVTGNDLLQYWEEDPATDVILLYLESFGNPRRFARIARRVSRTKPIVCVKGGRSSAGTRAASSHTAALAASETAVDALFRQTGVIRAETLGEMFDLALTLGTQPLPTGRRVGIVTNAGGPAILCADACEAAGLTVPELSESVRACLRGFLPPAASVGNPVDMIASAGPEGFRRSVETVLTSREVDALVVIHIPVGLAGKEPVRAAVMEGVAAARAAGVTEVPVISVIMGDDAERTPIRSERGTVPTYSFPESAARVLGKISDYAEWRRQPPGMIPLFEDVRPEEARAICRNALALRGPGWLTSEETRRLLSAYRLPIPPGGVAATADEAARLARSVGFPVAVKLASHRVVHKTEAGGVHLNLVDESAVRRAFEEVCGAMTKLGERESMEGVLVQPMLAGGVEVMIGMAEDPLFGPLIAFGLGGIHVEVLRDVCFRVTPVTDREAAEMVRGIRGFRLLQGYRGHPPADVPAIEESLLRVSLLVEEIPEVCEVDLNPVFALPPGQGCRIVDARIRVAPPDARQPARMGVAAGTGDRSGNAALAPAIPPLDGAHLRPAGAGAPRPRPPADPGA